MRLLKAKKGKKVHKFGAVAIKGYRSKLEQYTANKLKERNVDHCYECSTFELLPSFDFYAYRPLDGRKTSTKVKPITYTPDFVGEN